MIKDYIEAVIGEYIPQAEAGLASIDWAYIFAGCALLLTLFCVWKIVGTVISRV